MGKAMDFQFAMFVDWRLFGIMNPPNWKPYLEDHPSYLASFCGATNWELLRITTILITTS